MSAQNDPHGHQHPRVRPDQEELLAPSTQIVSDRDAYLGQGRHDVGRRISDDQVELFASTSPSQALQIEFAQHDPAFVAVHDVGTSASLRLLNSLAGAMGSRLQRLTIRRQGHGEAMAVLQFVEVPMAEGRPVRVYCTDISENANTRSAIASVLLGHSRLGVLLMGNAPASLVATQLKTLNDAVHGGAWPNRELLMVPLGAGVALAAHAAQLSERSSIAVHVTPQAQKTRQAWSYIAGAWNRLHGGRGGQLMPSEFHGSATAAPPPPVPSSEAPTEPMGLHDSLPSQPAPLPATAHPWQSYADGCALLKGVVACCVLDTLTMHELAHTGLSHPAGTLADQGGKLLRAMSEATRTLGLGSLPSDGSVSTGTHHLLVRPVPGHHGVAVHLVLSAATNLTLARMQLERISPPPAGTPHAQ